METIVFTINHSNMKKVFIALALLCACNQNTQEHHTYKNGEILLPDYVHLDTLIVVNADSLNWAMGYYDPASDGDIADILRIYTVKK